MKTARPIMLLVLSGMLMPIVNARPIGFVKQEPGQEVTGIVTYRQRTPLPRNAVLSLRIIDASTYNETPPVIARQNIPITHQVPISFDLAVPGGVINYNHTYHLEAVINVRGRTIWRNSTINPVITNGNATRYIVLMAPTIRRTRK